MNDKLKIHVDGFGSFSEVDHIDVNTRFGKVRIAVNHFGIEIWSENRMIITPNAGNVIYIRNEYNERDIH